MGHPEAPSHRSSLAPVGRSENLLENLLKLLRWATRSDRKSFARLQPALWYSVSSRAQRKNPSDNRAGGVAVPECAHRVPQGLIEAGARMRNDPNAQRHSVGSGNA